MKTSNQHLPAGSGDVLFGTRPGPFLMVAAAPYAVLLLVSLVLMPRQGWTGLIVVAAVLLGAAVKLGGRAFELRRLRQPWTLRIGADGVTWQQSGDHLDWSEVGEIRLEERPTIWSWLVPRGLRLVTRAELDFARRAKSRPMGWPIDTRYLDGDAEDVLAAIRRFADLPVVRT